VLFVSTSNGRPPQPSRHPNTRTVTSQIVYTVANITTSPLHIDQYAGNCSTALLTSPYNDGLLPSPTFATAATSRDYNLNFSQHTVTTMNQFNLPVSPGSDGLPLSLMTPATANNYVTTSSPAATATSRGPNTNPNPNQSSVANVSQLDFPASPANDGLPPLLMTPATAAGNYDCFASSSSSAAAATTTTATSRHPAVAVVSPFILRSTSTDDHNHDDDDETGLKSIVSSSTTPQRDGSSASSQQRDNTISGDDETTLKQVFTAAAGNSTRTQNSHRYVDDDDNGEDTVTEQVYSSSVTSPAATDAQQTTVYQERVEAGLVTRSNQSLPTRNVLSYEEENTALKHICSTDG